MDRTRDPNGASYGHRHMALNNYGHARTTLRNDPLCMETEAQSVASTSTHSTGRSRESYPSPSKDKDRFSSSVSTLSRRCSTSPHVHTIRNNPSASITIPASRYPHLQHPETVAYYYLYGDQGSFCAESSGTDAYASESRQSDDDRDETRTFLSSHFSDSSRDLETLEEPDRPPDTPVSPGSFLVCSSKDKETHSVMLDPSKEAAFRSNEETASTGPSLPMHADSSNLPDKITWKIFLVLTGVMISIGLASLDATVVSTALPSIMDELGSIERYSWIATAYIMTCTAIMPICGKGLGSGGVLALSVVFLNEIVPPRLRGLLQGIGAAVVAFAALMGPITGSIVVEKASWRWAFYFNVPLAGVAFLLVLLFDRAPSQRLCTMKNLKRIDARGCVLIVLATTSFLLALSWGGMDYPWQSWQVLVPLIVSFLLYGFFVYLETNPKLTVEPIIPVKLLYRNKNFAISTLSAILFGGVQTAGLFFLPLHMQVVKSLSAFHAGIRISPILVSSVIASLVGGVVAHKTSKVVILCIVGPALAAFGSGFLMLFDESTPLANEIAVLAVGGFGLGIVNQALCVLVQQSFDEELSSMALTAHIFFRSVGGLVTTAGVNTLLNNRWKLEIEHVLGFRIPSGLGLGSIKIRDIATLPALFKNAVIKGFLRAIKWVWLAFALMMVVEVLISLFHDDVPPPLPEKGESEKEVTDSTDGTA
ncbi:hypothetical protein HDU96_004306 [Phlyctochytrium bullatum]|nr:hypothetical protein HDU96_004306 [Phlyctochytrium bullatum]